MVGYRAAGWTILAAGLIAFGIGLVGLRGIGYVGQNRNGGSVKNGEREESNETNIELGMMEKNGGRSEGRSIQELSES